MGQAILGKNRSDAVNVLGLDLLDNYNLPNITNQTSTNYLTLSNKLDTYKNGQRVLLQIPSDYKNSYITAITQDYFVTVGEDGISAYSLDGETWIDMSGLDTDVRYYGIAYGNGRFVAVGDNGKSAYSIDGETWIETTGLNTSYTYYSVAYGDGRFVAVGSSGRSAYSLDGITWTALSNTTMSYTMNSVRYCNDKFICAANSGTIYYLNSGATSWSTASSNAGSSYGVYDVAYGNNVYVYIANAGRNGYSSDGKSWIRNSTNLAGNGSAVIYANGIFVAFAAGATSSNENVYNSIDGKTWTLVKTLSGSTSKGLAYGNGKFVAVGNDGYCVYSTDGITWIETTGLDTSKSYQGLALGSLTKNTEFPTTNYININNLGNKQINGTLEANKRFELIYNGSSFDVFNIPNELFNLKEVE